MTPEREARLWQLFMFLNEGGSDYERRTADISVHFRVQKAYRLLQDYERELAGINAQEETITQGGVMLVSDLDLTVRNLNCLRFENIQTVDELCRWSPRRLRLIPNLGIKGVRQIQEELSRHGRTLMEDRT